MPNPVVVRKLKDARIKLFKKSEGLAFFGACIYMFDVKVHKMNPTTEGYVLFDKDAGDVADGTIHINEDMVLKQDYTHVHLAFIKCHELLHILLKHGVRKGNRVHEVWAVACDHVVERDLKDLSSAIVPYDNRYHIIDELHKEKPQCTVEEAYEWLKKGIEDGKIKVTIIPNGEGMASFEGPNGQQFNVNMQIGGVDEEKIKAKNLEVIKTSDKIVSEARALHHTMKTKGSDSGALASYLDEILKVEIPWETLLEKAIKTNVIMKPDERSWKKLHYMYRPHGINLPGSTIAEDRDGVGILIIFVDSSGSMSDDELKKASSVIEQSMHYFEEIWVYVHDVRIQQEKIFTADERHAFFAFIKNEGYKGRGGTSHQYVFKAVQDNIWDSNGKKDDVSMAISFTDGASDIESQITQYEWLRVVPMTFVISGNYQIGEIDMQNVQTIYIDKPNV
jgi:predicted metal-dependent peptidase